MKKNIVLILFLAITIIAKSQNKEIHGTIYAFNKYPLKNVKIIAKKSKQEVLTDENGKFTITVEKNDMLLVEAKTFESYRYRVNDKDKEIKINLIYLDKKQNEDLAVNLGYLNREDLENGINNMMDQNNVYSNFIDIFDAIHYAIPSAQILNVGGHKEVQLRGQKSINELTTALFIVNGVPMEDISFIFPYDVISIKMLTNAQSAIYGSRAGGGVITITTK